MKEVAINNVTIEKYIGMPEHDKMLAKVVAHLN